MLGGAGGVAAVAVVVAAGVAFVLHSLAFDESPSPAVVETSDRSATPAPSDTDDGENTPGSGNLDTAMVQRPAQTDETALSQGQSAPSATTADVAQEAIPAMQAEVDADASDGATETDGTGLRVPEFAHVRVSGDGRAVVSGLAPAGFDVSVEVDGADLHTVSADGTGQFAALFDLPRSNAAQVLYLVARDGGGQEIRSDESVILAPRLAGQSGTDVALAGDTTREVARAEVAGTEVSVDNAQELEATGDAGVVSDATSASAAAGVATTPLATERSDRQEWEAPGGMPPAEVVPAHAGDALAPSVLLAGRDGVELLQPANAIPQRLHDRVVVDVISYSDDGSVALEGRAATNVDRADRVQVYLNNRPVQSARIAPDGRWHLRLPAVKPGVYTLRVDQVAPDGRVVARFETPFKREDPAELARLIPEAGAAGAVSASVITVQPGYTLWGIAADRYGDGLEYVQIFEANQGQIRDPDLIYPGQVFELPEGAADAGAE